MTFKDGGTSIGTGTLTPTPLPGGEGQSSTSSTATFTTSGLSLTTHTLTAVYNGDGVNFVGTTPSNSVTQLVGQASTTTTVASSTGTSASGQSVTFTATVVPAYSGVPTGTVTFADGGGSIGTGALTPTPLPGGEGQIMTATLTAPTSVIDGVGLHTITALYGSDTNYTSSTGTLTGGQTVVPAGTTIALTLTLNNSSVQGNPITLTATVTGLSGTFDNGGTVSFTQDGSTPTTVTLSGGLATFSTSALAMGLHTFTASYSGDTNYSLSTQASLTQTVRGTSSTTVSASPNPINFSTNGSVTMTATVAGGSGITPTGTVTFEDGSMSLGTAGLTGTTTATATYTMIGLSGGTHSLSAVYGGDSNLFSSTAPALPETVNQAASSTNLTYLGNVVYDIYPDFYGTPLSYTVGVSSGAGTPTGTVTFYDGSTLVGTATLTSGQLTFTTSSLPVNSGFQYVTAVYGGDTNFNGSTSSSYIDINVAQGNTTTMLSSSGNPSMVGQSVTFTATVTVAGGGNAPATGTVTFRDNGVALGTASVSTTNTATMTTAALTIAGSPHTITAVYSGDSNVLRWPGGEQYRGDRQ